MPRSTTGQLAETTNVSETVVRGIVDKAIESGIVDGFGSGRGRTYMLSSNVYKTKSARIGYVRQADIDETRYTELIINMAKANEYIARADVVKLLHVSDSKAYSLLKKLVKLGILEPINKGRYAKYRYIGG